jgi:hypothetical protein
MLGLVWELPLTSHPLGGNLASLYLAGGILIPAVPFACIASSNSLGPGLEIAFSRKSPWNLSLQTPD